MADQTIQVPPPHGPINLTVGNYLHIDANVACTFCCSIGDHFSPDITSLPLAKGSHTSYRALTAGSGKYNASEGVNPCDPSAPHILTAKSVQINNPLAKRKK